MKLAISLIGGITLCYQFVLAQSLPPWTYTNTGASHTNIITTSANPGINGVPLTNGDYIGVFYDLNGTLNCGGYERWTGTSNITIAAWGDDPNTTAKDGFAIGETFMWKIWRHTDGSVFDANASYLPVGSLGGIIANTNSYATNGISGLSSLGVSITIPWTFTNTGISHTIIIQASINPNIFGSPLTNGDAIGVFYDLNGTPTCGGYVLWNSGNTSVPAWGDDPNTPGKDGFANNETIQWKIWRHTDGRVFSATATYWPVGSLGGIVTNTSRFGINGISALKSLEAGFIATDGDFGDALYQQIAVKSNTNNGFGPNIDITKIVYYPDPTYQQLYIGIAGKVNTAASDGIGIWLGFSELTGIPAGISLGGSPGAHYMGNTGNNNFKADFEVDYMFAVDPANSASNLNVNGTKLVGTRTSSFLGNCGQLGAATSGPAGSADFFAQQSVSFAFNNDGGSNHGFEIRIPYSQLGVTSAGNVMIFSFLVRSDAYFSDVTIPGNVSQFVTPLTNPGFNPNFAAMQGGPFHSPSSPLPVQLTFFTGSMVGAHVHLQWRTASELNNYGFEVQKSQHPTGGFQTIPNSLIAGHGTTNQPHSYSYIDQTASVDMGYYRLKQIDLDGAVHYSEPITIQIPTTVGERELPKTFALEQNYPNPFNPGTTIEFALPKTSHVKLEVFNTLGQRVADLVNESREAGYYSERFDASQLATGIYLYRLQAGDFTKVRKLLVLK